MRFDNGAFATPPVVKNLIIINALFFLAEEILPNGLGNVLVERLGLYSWQSPNFHLYQLVTHMFLHGSLTHLFICSPCGCSDVPWNIRWAVKGF